MKKILIILCFMGLAILGYSQTLIEHISNSSNISRHITTIDNPATNNKPDAILIVTQNYGVYNVNEVGVWYSAGKWKIFNQNKKPMPKGNRFNILVLPKKNAKAFVHTTTQSNTKGHITTLEHSLTNTKSKALVFITQNYGKYNISSTGVWYSSGRWKVYNEDRKSMPLGTKFNVFVVDGGAVQGMHGVKGTAFQHTDESNSHISWMRHSDAKDKASRLFVTQNYNGKYNANAIGVWYAQGKWTAYNQNRTPISNGVRFNVLAVKPNAVIAPTKPTSTIQTQTGISGTWTNKDSNTRGITKVIISKDESKIHAYGKCHPSDCDWKTTALKKYKPKFVKMGYIYKALYDQGFGTKEISISKISSNEIRLTVSAKYRDKRPDRTNTYYMTKSTSSNQAALKEDCVRFNPKTISIKNNRIVDGNHSMMSFPNYAEAKKAYDIIKRYGLNQSCFVGRPYPSFTYLLKDGKSPVGAVEGEDCIGFNPSKLYLKREGSQYLMTDGRSRMFMFPNKAEAEAALSTIKKYGFTKTCYVGRPNSSLQYMRKGTGSNTNGNSNPINPTLSDTYSKIPITADVKARYGTYGCNTCVPNVPVVFGKASGSSKMRKSYQFAPTNRPLNDVAKPEEFAQWKKDHIQGITRLSGVGHENHFAMTRNARKGIDGGLYIGKFDGIRSDGGSWAAASTQFSNRATKYSYHRFRGLNHAGGLQALGSMIFVAADCNEKQTCDAEIKIIDARQPERPKEINALVIDGRQNELSPSQTRTAAGKTIKGVSSSAAAVAAIRLQSGHYLVFVYGGGKGWFYISNTSEINKNTKWEFLDFWHQDDIKSGAKWYSYENINLIADCNGSIYMVGMGTNNNISALYHLTSRYNSYTKKRTFNFEYVNKRGLDTDTPFISDFLDEFERPIIRGILSLIPISIGGYRPDRLHEAGALWSVTLRNGGGIHITRNKGLVSYATGREPTIQIDEFRYHGETDRGRTQVASIAIPIKKNGADSRTTNENNFSFDFNKMRIVKVSKGWAVTDGKTEAVVLRTKEDAEKAIDIIKKHKGIK